MRKTIMFCAGQPKSGLANYVINLMPEFNKKHYPIRAYNFVYYKQKYEMPNSTPVYGFIPFNNSWLINDVLGLKDKALMKLVTPDIGIVHFAEPMSLPSIRKLQELKESNIELVCTVRDLIDAFIGDFNYHVDESFYIRFARWLLGRNHSTRCIEDVKKLLYMDNIICISESTKQDLIKLFHLLNLRYEENNISVIYHGVDKRTFKQLTPDKKAMRYLNYIPLDCKLIVCVSSEEPRKNVASLYRAFSMLPKSYRLVRIIRNGHMTLENKKLIKELDIQERIIFQKDVDTEHYAQLLNAADVFVLPTIYEGFCNTVIEAQACGTPVITTHETSLKEVVRDSAMIIKEPFNAVEIKNKILKLMKSEDLRKKYIKLGYMNASRFSWKKNVEEIIKVYGANNDE